MAVAGGGEAGSESGPAARRRLKQLRRGRSNRERAVRAPDDQDLPVLEERGRMAEWGIDETGGNCGPLVRRWIEQLSRDLWGV